jgi:hypothetical protein
MNRPHVVAAFVLFGAVLVPLRAASGEHEFSQAAARRIGQEAEKLYEAGDYAAALEKFNAAYAVLPTATFGLYAARCLVKVDRLVEASERYLEVTRLELARNAPKAMLKAQVDAAAEREKLLPTIPSLEILLEGARGGGVDVTVDAKPLLPGLLGDKRRVNPGRHRIEAKRGDATVRKEITLAAGESARVVLELPALSAPPTPRVPLMRKVGWGAIGVAGAGVVVGGIAGAVAFAKEQSLLKTCPNYLCQSSADLARAGSYDAARAASTVGFVVGGAALAAGVTLLLVSPKVEYIDANGHVVPAPKDSARIGPFVGPGGGGLQGAF